MKHRAGYLGAIAVVGLMLSGCQSGPPESVAAAPSESAVATPTPVVTSEPPAPASDTPSPVSSGVIGAPSGETVELSLTDAKRGDGWREGNYRIPGGSEAITAIGTSLSSCGSGKEELEFRFEKQSGQLAFDVAQDLNSDRSDVVLEFSLLANGRTIDTEQIAFDQSAKLSTPLDGVSAVILEVKVASRGNSCGSTTALVTSAVIEG